jgi:hypothetical protein
MVRNVFFPHCVKVKMCVRMVRNVFLLLANTRNVLRAERNFAGQSAIYLENREIPKCTSLVECGSVKYITSHGHGTVCRLDDPWYTAMICVSGIVAMFSLPVLHLTDPTTHNALQICDI